MKNAMIQKTNLISQYTFENFVISDSNKSIFNNCLEVAKSPGKLNNPLFIYGKSGLGKTYLLHAIGNYIDKHNSSLNILYITSTDFMKEYIDIATKHNIEACNELRNKYRSVDVLIIDDIQYLKDAKKTQQVLSHIINDLLSKNKQVVISSNQELDSLNLLEDLHICIDSAFKVNILPPDFELCIGIIDKNIENLSIADSVQLDVKEYIANNYGSDIRKLERAITRILAYSSIVNDSNITLNLVIDALKDYAEN